MIVFLEVRIINKTKETIEQIALVSAETLPPKKKYYNS
jgi:hypothetical protein